MHDIDNLPESWKALLETAGKKSFFYGYDWFATLAGKALNTQISPRVYGIETINGTPIMVMVMQTPSAVAGSVLRNVSRREGSLSSLTNFYSCEFYPAIGVGVEPTFPMRELARYLKKESPRWSFIEINSLDHDTSFFDITVDAFRRAGFIVGTKFHFGNWYDHFDNKSYAEYWKKRPARERKKFKNFPRLHRKLQRMGEVEFRLFKDELNIEQAIEDFFKIYTHSWKAPQHSEFIPTLLRRAARSDRLRMGILYFNGVPIATQVGMLTGRRVTMTQTAYDNEYTEYSVGSIVTMLVIEHLVDVEKVCEIDFGRDDQYYKKIWLTKRRERWAIVAFNPCKLNALRMMPAFFWKIIIDRIAEWARPWAKPLLLKLRLRK